MEMNRANIPENPTKERYARGEGFKKGDCAEH